MPEKLEKAVKDIATLNLYQRMAAITGEIGSIAKGGENREQHYSFIEYAAVAGALRTLFSKYNVVCLPTMGARTETEFKTPRGGVGYRVLIDFKFAFINGDKPEEREFIDWTGEAIDYGDKATNKAATAALKYCLMRTFNVSEKGDEDPDMTSPQNGATVMTRTLPAQGSLCTPAQKLELKKLMEHKGITDELMSDFVTTVLERATVITYNDYLKVKNVLEEK
jgi:hypothetical protein